MNAIVEHEFRRSSVLRAGARLLPLLLLATAACSAPTAETAGEKTSSTKSAYSDRAWVDGNVAKVQALDQTTVFVLGTDGNLWRETGSMSNRTWVDGNVRDFQAINAGAIYVLSNDGTLWREAGNMTDRVPVDYNVTSFQALSDGYTVYVLGGGNLWREFGTYQRREQVDGNVASFQAIDGTTVYVEGTDSKLWREFGWYSNSTNPRQQIDSNVASFKAIDASTVYVLGSDGKLWNGGYGNRFQVDANVQSFAPVDGAVVFVEGTDGNLWREVVDSRFRDPVDGNVSAFQPIGNQLAYVLGTDGNLWRESMPQAPWVLTAQKHLTGAPSGADFSGAVGIWPNGDFIFTGHAHDNDPFSYNDAFAMGVATSSGQLFTFAHQGSIGGWGAPTADDYWTTTGNNAQLANSFNSIQLPPGSSASISPAVDWGTILSDIETGVGVVLNVIAIVGPFLG